ncbi:MAG: BrnT family toxin [Treponema sp.]|jgi:uncharacterized DUF497 family protein|nr:BrnT family toxin [Treponema sp.]
MNYEWDIWKNQKNLRKHKITFEQAIPVIEDPYSLSIYDEKHSKKEDRYIVIGSVNELVLFVSIIQIDENTVRILPQEKQKHMKRRRIMKIVRYTSETAPKPTKEDWERTAALKDKDINCSDIPEVRDFSGFQPFVNRKMYKPVKVAVTCKLDADIVAWLKLDGKGYQTRMNSILRQVMVHENAPSYNTNRTKEP